MRVVWAVIVTTLCQARRWLSGGSIGLWGAHDDAVIGMCFDMFLQILWSLKRLPAEFALVWLEGDMDSDVGGDVVTLDRRGSALTPSAGQVEVVRGLATYVSLTHMFLSRY